MEFLLNSFYDTALHIAVNNKNVDVINRFLNVPGIKFNIRNLGVLFLFLMEFYFYIFNRAAFDLAPRKFILQFRPRMNEILAEARAKIREIKKAKNEMKKQKKEMRIAQKNESNIDQIMEEEINDEPME